MIFRFLLLSAALLSFTSHSLRAAPAAGGENQFGVSITLFTTMAAINAAGYDADLNSKANYPIRNQVRQELAKRNIPSLPELKNFYLNHRKGTDSATLSQYISFALLAGNPPDFKVDSGELPPDAQSVEGLSDLLARFYKEADIENLWKRSQPAFLAAVQRYQEPVVNALLEANSYLRNPTSGAANRRFEIYMSLLAQPNVVQVRNYKGDYFVVITPSYEPLVNEVRSAYLSYLLDPLSLRFSRELDAKRVLQKYAEEAPALDEIYKNEFSLLVTKSLIKAIESRLMHGTDKRQSYINEALREGYILTPAFAELLPAYEKQPEAMSLYYPDLIGAIDIGKEKKRLRDVQFAQTVTRPVAAAPPSAQEMNPAEQAIEQAEALLNQHDFAGSKKLFQKSLTETDSQPMHGQAYFGLAQVAVQQHQADQAAALFEKVVAMNTDPATVAWSHVYLGRLAMLHDDPQGATDHFKKALALEGAPDKAREAAQNDLAKVSGEQKQ